MVRLSLVNTALSLSSLSTSSIVGIGCLERSLAVLAILISTHFLMSPFCLGMTTIGLTRRWTFHSLSDVHILQFCQLFLYFAVKTVWDMSAWLCYKLCIRLEMQFNGIICQFPTLSLNSSWNSLSTRFTLDSGTLIASTPSCIAVFLPSMGLPLFEITRNSISDKCFSPSSTFDQNFASTWTLLAVAQDCMDLFSNWLLHLIPFDWSCSHN